MGDAGLSVLQRRRATTSPRRSQKVDQTYPVIRPLAGFWCGLAVLTIFWPNWIEALTG